MRFVQRTRPTPTLTQVRALHGRIVSMLTAEEAAVLEFYLVQGRKRQVKVAIINEANPAELAAARSALEADAIMKRADNRVVISVSRSAATVRPARCSRACRISSHQNGCKSR